MNRIQYCKKRSYQLNKVKGCHFKDSGKKQVKVKKQGFIPGKKKMCRPQLIDLEDEQSSNNSELKMSDEVSKISQNLDLRQIAINQQQQQNIGFDLDDQLEQKDNKQKQKQRLIMMENNWIQQATNLQKQQKRQNPSKKRVEIELSKKPNRTFEYVRPLTRKSFTRQQYCQLRKYFQKIHNYEPNFMYQLSQEQRREKLTMKKIAETFGCSPNTVNILYKYWKYDPTFQSKFKHQVTYVRNGLQKTAIIHQLTARRVTQLIEIVRANPYLTQAQMAQQMKKVNPVQNFDVGKGSISWCLQLGNIQKKRIRQLNSIKNTRQYIEQRRQFALKLKQTKLQTSMIYFYDQIVVSKYFDRDFYFSVNSQEVNLKLWEDLNNSIFVICMLGLDGEFLWDAKFTNYNQQEYASTLSRFFKTIKTGRGRDSIIINKPSYRDMSALYQSAMSAGWNILKMARQSGPLNPLKGIQKQLIQQLKKIKFTTMQQLFRDTVLILQKKQMSTICLKHVKQMNEHIERAIIRQEFD